MAESEFVVVLPKGHKKQKVQRFCCTLCKCTYTNLEVHLNSHKHLRLANIQEILPNLQQHVIGKNSSIFVAFHC
jgi:hypothetical protein